MIANAFYLPHHLLPKAEPEKPSTELGGGAALPQVTRKTE
jgi:hypothetical protein